jgi:solute carrier family 35
MRRVCLPFQYIYKINSLNQLLAANLTTKGRMDVVAAIASYSFCSSFMLIVNKLVISYIPAPSLVSCIQLVVCIISIVVANYLGFVVLDTVRLSDLKWLFIYSGIFPEKCGSMRYQNAILNVQLLAPALFVSGIVFNLGALERANVETLIVARSCLPLATSILDYIFLGRQVVFALFWKMMIDEIICS